MEGCGTWLDVLNGCLGRGHMTEDQPIELTPQRNAYARKLMDHMNGTGGSQADPSRPLPRSPGGRTSLDGTVQIQRSPQDLGSLGSNTENRAPTDPEYDNAWHEMLDTLHNALEHTRYAVSGRMAMSVWGCSTGARDALSVICPAESKEAVKIWAISTGGRFAMPDAEPDILTFESRAGSYGKRRLWRIRIRWVPEGRFEAMPKVEVGLPRSANPYAGGRQTGHVNVLTLPALLDNSAGTWVDNISKGMLQERLDVVARDVLSILDRIIDLSFQPSGAGPLTEAECHRVLDKAFWVPFTQRYPDAPVKFAQCGLRIPHYTMSQPGPSTGMNYPGASSTLPRLTPAPPPKSAGRSLMARKTAPDHHGKAAATEVPAAASKRPCKQVPGPTAREKAAAAHVEPERREKGQERGRKHERRAPRRRDGEEVGRKKSRQVRRDRPRGSTSDPVPSASRRDHYGGTTARDGTKVSNSDASTLPNERVPRRGRFADLVIEDDGEM